jgi:hypothetical protein
MSRLGHVLVASVLMLTVSCSQEDAPDVRQPDSMRQAEISTIQSPDVFALNDGGEAALTDKELTAIAEAVKNLTLGICNMNPAQQRQLLIDVLASSVANIVCSQRGLDVYAPKKSLMTKSCLRLVTSAAASRISSAIDAARCPRESKKPASVNGPTK